LEAQRDLLVTSLREAISERKQLSSAVDIVAVQKQLDESREAASKLAVLAERKTNLEQLIDVTSTDLRKARTYQTKIKRLDKWQHDLASWRDVLHREQLPQLFMRSVLEEVVDDMNRLLEDFDGPFRVSVDDGLTFMIHNNDGSVEPSSAKSGGEETVLAIVYRLAINARFTNDVGMLVLDEPTAGLDEHYLGCLADVLTRLNEITKKRRQQVIMVTHDQRLERVFDQLIRFE
jgi:DNA repair exonuclease SbcCD ATPase subunit